MKELAKQIEFLNSRIEGDRQSNIEAMNSLSEKYKQTTVKFEQANLNLKNAVWSVKKLQQQISWTKRTEWFTPLFALLIAGLSGGIAGATLTSRYFNSPSEKLGRNIAKWNQKQLIECIESQNTQCTIRLVP